MIRRPPRSTLFPSAPLFRSREEPQAPTPPEGAILYYSLAVKPSAHITVDVLDARGDVVRHLTGAPTQAVREAARPPMESFWLARPSALPVDVGLNRATRDMGYEAPPAFAHSLACDGH